MKDSNELVAGFKQLAAEHRRLADEIDGLKDEQLYRACAAATFTLRKAALTVEQNAVRIEARYVKIVEKEGAPHDDA